MSEIKSSAAPGWTYTTGADGQIVSASYTPGPWVPAEFSAKKNGGIDDAWAVYREPPDPATHNMPAVCYGPRGEANARLIAAAPELLEALRELAAEAPFATEVPGHPLNCECGEFVDYVPAKDEPSTCRHTRARAAIAKATGEGR